MADLAFKVDIDGNGFAKVSKLSGNFKKADSSAQKFGKALKGATVIAGAFAGAATAGALAIGAIIKQTLEQIDATTKASRAVGVQTELYTGLIHVAKLGGIEQEKLNGSLKRFARNMNDAEKGIGTGKVAFEQLGISIKDNEGDLKTQEDLMLDIADRFSEMENGAQKTAIAQDIFGKSGADMINVLNAGSDAMREQLLSAEALGVVFSEELGVKAEFFNDRLEEVGASLQGFKLRATAAFADSKLFNAFINGFEAMSKTISDFISGEQFSDYLEYIFVTLQDLIQPISAVIATFKGLGTVLFNIGQIIVDGTISNFLNLVEVIAGVGEAIGRFVSGDFKGAQQVASRVVNNIGDDLEELKNNTVGNLKDIGEAFTGIEDDYLSMANGMNDTFDKVNDGFDKMKNSQKEYSEAAQLSSQANAKAIQEELKALEKLEAEKLKLANEQVQKFLALDEQVRKEHQEKTTEQFTLLREQELMEHEARLSMLSEFDSSIEEQKELHALKMADIAEKEAKHIEDMEKKKQQAHLDTFNVYAQVGQNMIGTMQEVFGKNKIFSAAMITAQGAQAVVNALATPPFPLGLSLAALATAKTASSLASLNSTKAFALGGVVGGGEQMIRVNEQGNEAVLNASTTRSLGRETIDLLNNGRADMLNPMGNSKPQININVNGVLSRDVFENEIRPHMEQDMAFR
jgi:hypothetical protein